MKYVPTRASLMAHYAYLADETQPNRLHTEWVRAWNCSNTELMRAVATRLDMLGAAPEYMKPWIVGGAS